MTTREDQISAELQAFQHQPAAFMNRLPTKYDRQGNPLPEQTTLFDADALSDKAYVLARDALRQQLTEAEDLAPGRAAFAENDRADGFVDTYRYAGLQSMEDNGLTHSELETAPWSDDYWAIYLGILGKRYGDADFPFSLDWSKNYGYIQRHPAREILASGDPAAIDQLSPAEKYDALVGDANQSLTTYLWQEGKRYYVGAGQVEPWMGICHGWAPAAYMLPRPTGTAQVLSAEGIPLTFYPADIKALASLLWANTRTETRFVGGRCNDKDPASDPQTGRLLAIDCFDTNPGTWHLAMVNQIGVSHRSLVMDATYDYEVWNQPVLAYRYSYFNPQTARPSPSLAAATVPLADLSPDRFGAYRSPDTESVVGIAMDVDYVVETSPRQQPEDSVSNDAVHRARYLYELELDGVGNIVGGEWYRNAHPDFLWTPPAGSRALTIWERLYELPGSWRQDQPVPDQWQRIATITSLYAGAPLAAIVEQLIAFTNE